MSRPKGPPSKTRPIRLPVKLNEQLADINVSKVCGQFLSYLRYKKIGPKKASFVVNLVMAKADKETDPDRRKTLLKLAESLALLLKIGNDSELPKKSS